MQKKKKKFERQGNVIKKEHESTTNSTRGEKQAPNETRNKKIK